MKAKILKCSIKEYEGKVVEVYHKYKSGIEFIGKHGIVFVNNGDYKEVYKEILQLKEYCDKIGVSCKLENCWDGYAIRFNNGGDFVQHCGSYGNDYGCVEPAIGCRSDYTPVKLENAKQLIKRRKNTL